MALVDDATYANSIGVGKRAPAQLKDRRANEVIFDYFGRYEAIIEQEGNIEIYRYPKSDLVTLLDAADVKGWRRSRLNNDLAERGEYVARTDFVFMLQKNSTELARGRGRDGPYKEVYNFCLGEANAKK
ncbi:TPA: hypothetical protein HA278_06030 [Candidatus Woesearchaeota archaeon]|nr:hypothetical protein [archaeon]HIJ11590.1 hypothetical protein [Candidatus Woesearchaeota archaeon]